MPIGRDAGIAQITAVARAGLHQRAMRWIYEFLNSILIDSVCQEEIMVDLFAQIFPTLIVIASLVGASRLICDDL
jgi:hypothetical protein